MRWARIKDFLLPTAERDEGFQQEVLRLSHLSLRVIAGVQVGVAAFMFLARLVVAPDPATLRFRAAQTGVTIVLGVAIFLLARCEWTYPRARWLAIASGLAITTMLVTSSLVLSVEAPEFDSYVPGQITLAMLVAVAAIPLRPLHTLSIGAALGAVYAVSSTLVGRWSPLAAGYQETYLVFIAMLTILSVGLTAEVYAQRAANYFSYRQTLEAYDGLRQAQARVLLSENAASLARLAAALSHELNSPVGALTSGVDTFLLLAARQATSPPEQHPRLVELQADLRRTIQESSARLRQIVARMQRFTNLDKADVQQVNVNELVRDVIALIDQQVLGRASVEFDLAPLPPIVCRPQQLSAVFSNLLANALNALEGGGEILIITRQTDSRIEIRIQDSGRGLKPAELANVFDPGFTVAGGRVSTGNWSLFNARQILREHGGDIRISSAAGQGTTVTVILPCEHDERSLRVPT